MNRLLSVNGVCQNQSEGLIILWPKPKSKEGAMKWESRPICLVLFSMIAILLQSFRLVTGFVHSIPRQQRAITKAADATLFVFGRRGGFQPRILNLASTRILSSSSSSSGEEKASDTLSHAEISRYSRHLVLSDVGMKGQKALKESSVLVVGAGGLGSPCLLYLAAAGVGHIGIVDADTVDESNLQRQIIHGTSTVGKSKCRSAEERIRDINPHVRVRLYEEELTSESALRIMGEGFDETVPYDVVVDGSDNFPTKYLIK